MAEKDAPGTASPPEDEHTALAREASRRLGIEPVSPEVGAALAVAAAAIGARSLLEVGTGAGVSALWLLRGAPEAQLTSIDADLDHQQVARHVLAEAGVPARRARLIPGRSDVVMPRMNDDAYDLVLVDAAPLEIAADLAAALKAVRPGGSVLVPHASRGGHVANPAKRDRATLAMREALRLAQRDDVLAVVNEIGDGLLHVVRLPAPVS